MPEVGSTTLSASGLHFTALDTGPVGEPAAAGDVVLCLHGFPDGPNTFRFQFGPLAAVGHRVIAPTLRGYEPSSQPDDGDYSLTTLAHDVVGWLDDLGVERAHLIGHDWGAAIVYVVAARHPDRVFTASTLAIPPLARIPRALRHVPRQLQRSWYMTFFQVRGVTERALRADDWRLVRRLWRSWSPGHVMTDDEWTELRTQFEQPGVVDGMLGYYRQNATPAILLGMRSTPAMQPAEIPVPMLIVHGADDGCMDRRLFGHTVRASDHPGGLTVLEIDGAGHFVHLEQPDVVNEALIDHIGGR